MCVLHTRLHDVLSQECISETCGISGCVGRVCRCTFTHSLVGQGPGHMGLVARSEAAEPEVGGACDGCGTLQSSLTFALLFMGVSFTSCHTGSH